MRGSMTSGRPNELGVSCQTLAVLMSPQCKQEDGTCDEMAKEIHFKDRVKPEDSAKFKCERRPQYLAT